MYQLTKKTALKSVPTAKQYFVSSGFYTMRQDFELGAFKSKKAAKEDLNESLFFADLAFGKSGITAEDYSIIEFSPLKFKAIETLGVKTMLRKKAVS